MFIFFFRCISTSTTYAEKECLIYALENQLDGAPCGICSIDEVNCSLHISKVNMGTVCKKETKRESTTVRKAVKMGGSGTFSKK